MGKLKKFDISFSNMREEFYAGEVMEGKVTVVLSEPMEARGITLTFGGLGSVRWSESQGSGQNRYTVTYKASDVYLDAKVMLLEGNQHGSRHTTAIIQGRHTFPFRFQLPTSLPSSFKSPISYIKYEVSCRIDKSRLFHETTKKAFKVIRPFDLNRRPYCAYPAEKQNSKHLLCLMCRSGPIEASLRTDKKGWVPGEAIKFYAEIHNGTSRGIANIFVVLKMKITYTANGGTATGDKEVAKADGHNIHAHGDGVSVWNGELIVPPLTPSFLEGCSFIDIRYVLKLVVKPSGPATKLKVPLDILIGTTPVAPVVQQQPLTPVAVENTFNSPQNRTGSSGNYPLHIRVQPYMSPAYNLTTFSDSVPPRPL